MSLENKKDCDSESGEGLDIITWDELEDIVESILDVVPDKDYSHYFAYEIEDLEFSSNWEKDQNLLDDIKGEVLNSFKKGWDELNTTKDQNSYFRIKAIDFAQKLSWNNAYFQVGNRKVRKKVYEQHKKKNYTETFSMNIDVFEKNLFEEFLQFNIGYWVVIWVLREWWNDARENDFPSRFNFNYRDLVDTEFQLILGIDEEDEESEDTLEEKIKKLEKSVEIERNLVVSFWDWTLKDLFENGYSKNLLCDN